MPYEYVDATDLPAAVAAVRDLAADAVLRYSNGVTAPLRRLVVDNATRLLDGSGPAVNACITIADYGPVTGITLELRLADHTEAGFGLAADLRLRATGQPGLGGVYVPGFDPDAAE